MREVASTKGTDWENILAKDKSDKVLLSKHIKTS